MDQHEIFIPGGWTRSVLNGRIVYQTPAPFPVKIYSLADLSVYHRKGRFLDVKEDQLVFSRKRKKKEKNYVPHKVTVGNNFEDATEVGAFDTSLVREEAQDRNIDGLTEVGQVLDGDGLNDMMGLDDFNHSTEVPKIADNPLDLIKAGLAHEKKKTDKKRLDDEHARITEAVSKLTLDPKRKLDHKSVLEDAAIRLNEARVTSAG